MGTGHAVVTIFSCFHLIFHVLLYLFQLFNLGSDNAVSVTGLEFDRMPSDSMTEYKYFILATTPG